MLERGLDRETQSRKSEILLFLFLTFILIPGATVGFIGAYGFVIWIYQMLVGGPPAG
ncbi:nitrate reductase [Sneathiella chinensis]|uniref:Periplasmic nitrate reductase, NapE protein n=1 Tax=Sneathiella chinensis TaxID=349750 RepID=A0ABQ5U1E7_9PROT|nr:nitrate reductase [Sneathiella chinensis]GLQ05020.1 hypothetical protein GCM10007924_02410 [Sneathiella chinensis]